MAQLTEEELLERAKKPAKDAMVLHPFYRGKVQIAPKCIIRDLSDFAIWYTPGVAAPCKDIQAHPEMVYEHTNKGNTIAVVSDGTRVLGLGDIGPEAALPVMEGKALIFKYLGGVDAVPICLDTKDTYQIIQTVKLIQPSFGGINLEDIAQPKCFRVLNLLRTDPEVNIPVWHDDAQGTATVVLAGVLNALKLVGKKIDEAKFSLIGVGAANVATLRLLIASGAKWENIYACDSKGLLNSERADIAEHKTAFAEKWEICQYSNQECYMGGPEDAMRGTDVCIALSKPGPGTILPEWVKGMNEDAILFPCANPIPEIWPWEAKGAGARIVGTGRSDFPNQVNNSLCFPAMFRGVLDVRAATITDEMTVAAARALARFATERGIDEDNVVPKMDEWEVFPREAVAVAMKAQEQGVARLSLSPDELYTMARDKICAARDMTNYLIEQGLIAPVPEGMG